MDTGLQLYLHKLSVSERQRNSKKDISNSLDLLFTSILFRVSQVSLTFFDHFLNDMYAAAVWVRFVESFA